MWRDDCSPRTTAAKLEDHVVQQLPRRVAPVVFGTPCLVRKPQGIDRLRARIQPSGIVTGHLSVRHGSETIDGVWPPLLVQKPENARVELLVRAIEIAGQSVGPNIRLKTNISGSNMDAVGVQ